MKDLEIFHIQLLVEKFQDKVVDSEEEIISVEGAGETPAVPRPSSMPDSNVKLIEEALQTLKANSRDGGEQNIWKIIRKRGIVLQGIGMMMFF